MAHAKGLVQVGAERLAERRWRRARLVPVELDRDAAQLLRQFVLPMRVAHVIECSKVTRVQKVLSVTSAVICRE
jgi:hypothetical protein